jgi:DNA-binding NtrC family response regulator
MNISRRNSGAPVNQRILWIDDNVEMLANAVPVLESEGYQLTTLHAPENLTEILAASRPELIIVDLGFPGVGADLALLEQIARIAPQVPTIVFSGYSFQAYQAKALELGACCYLVKPMRIRELIDRIATILEPRVPVMP